MAIDKRFWSGALAVVTVVIAGASSLPSLLLAPAAPEPGYVTPQQPAPKPFDAAAAVAMLEAAAPKLKTEPVAARQERAPATLDIAAPKSEAVKTPPIVVPTQIVVAPPRPEFVRTANLTSAPQPAPPAVSPEVTSVPKPAPAVPEPQPVQAAPVSPPAEPPQTAADAAFPPVQPVGVASRTENATPVAAAPSRSRTVSAKPSSRKAERRRHVAATWEKPRRGVRPARFPIREFLAWRR